MWQAVIGKDVANQTRLREAGGVASLLAVIARSATSARSGAAEHAAALLYRLTLYRCAHAELQECGCVGALVPLLNGDNAVIQTHVTWAVHNLTGSLLTITQRSKDATSSGLAPSVTHPGLSVLWPRR